MDQVFLQTLHSFIVTSELNEVLLLTEFDCFVFWLPKRSKVVLFVQQFMVWVYTRYESGNKKKTLTASPMKMQTILIISRAEWSFQSTWEMSVLKKSY